MTMQNARGTRDFPPEQALARQNLALALKRVFELFGYNPLETPILERFEVLSSKYAGGAEILKETFKLNDQGERDIALRYDLTVPMCRFLAMNPSVKMPFKRYQIGEVFRDGPIKLGRYRQFTQCDVDVVGVKGMAADSEIISIAQFVFRRVGLDVTIKVNSRKVLNGILESAGISQSKLESVILSVDKLQKIGRKGVEKELEEKQVSAKSIAKVMDIITIVGSNSEKISRLRSMLGQGEGQEGLAEIEELLSFLPDSSNVVFDVSLARGLAYYTGPVFEVFLDSSEIKSAVAAGGRYDRMIGNFLGGRQEYPAVGISFGLDVILDAVGKFVKAKTSASVFVIPIKSNALGIAHSLRKAGVNTDIDLFGRSISKNLEYASSLGIPFVVFVGEKELSKGVVKLRDMSSGEERLVRVEEVQDAIRRNGV